MKIIDGGLCAVIILIILQLLSCVGNYNLVHQSSIVRIRWLQIQKYIMLISSTIVHIAARPVIDFHSVSITTLTLGTAMKHT